MHIMHTEGFLLVDNIITIINTTLLLPPFQNVSHFDFSRFIYFAMYLDILLYLDA